MVRLSRSVLLAVTGVALLAGWPGLASADARSTVTIRWTAPSACPSQSDVERDVVRTIGGRGVDRDPLEARVEVWRSGPGAWNGEIQLSAAGETTTRKVHGPTCLAVERAVALVVGVAAVQDPSLPPVLPASLPPPAPPSEPPEPAPFPTRTPTVASTQVPPPSSPSPPSSPTARTGAVASPPIRAASSPLTRASSPPALPSSASSPRFFARASVLLDAGSLPSVTPGVDLFVGWKPSFWDLELGGAYLATQSAVSNLPNQGADIWRAELLARACAGWGTRLIQAGPCIGASLAWFDATGKGANTPATGTTNVLGATLGGRASLRLTGWLAATLSADLLAPFSRPTFIITITNASPSTVYQPAAVAFRGSLGLEARF